MRMGHLLQVAWCGLKEVFRPLADVVLQGACDVIEVVHRPLVEALDDLRPQAPHALRYLHEEVAILNQEFCTPNACMADAWSCSCADVL